jgi:transcriptional regulator with XRE-family HTH domain
MNLINNIMNYNSTSVNISGYVSTPLKLAVAVRALRHAFDMSQTDLADLANCSRPTINRIESIDKASPRTDTIERLMQVFRDRGVEVQITDSEVMIRFSAEAINMATTTSSSTVEK